MRPITHGCRECMHFSRVGTCHEPVAAGLLSAKHGFGIVWPPAGFAARCVAFVAGKRGLPA